MATIVTRAGKGSPLTNTEVDANFTNLNTDKAELSGATFTGEIVANAGIALGDNDKAQFGAGSDLQIYHDGNNSRVEDVGTGGLRLIGSNFVSLQSTSGENKIVATSNGAVDLYHDNAIKLATTSTGIDVTGTATMDGLIVDGNNDIQINRDGISSAKIFWNRSGTTDAKIELDASENLTIAVDEAQLGSKSLVFKNNNADGLLISSTQNVNIPNGGLMVGATTAPARGLQIHKEGNHLSLTTTASGTAAGNGSDFKVDASSSDLQILNYESANTTFWTSGSERLKIDSQGRVGIGCSPTSPLHIKSATNVNVRFDDSGSSSYTWYMNDAQNLYIPNVQLASTHTFYANGQRKVDIDSSGNLLVGTTSATAGISASSGGGFVYRAGNELTVHREGIDATSPCAIFNQTGLNGQIVRFRKEGTTVGSWMSRAGLVSTIVLDPRSGQGAGLTGAGAGGDTLRHITPTNESGVEVNGKVSLGNSSNGFKDLYLSGKCNASRVFTDKDGDWGMEMSGVTTARLRFHTSAGGAGQVGSITVSTSSTSYSTSSDYRLKENVVELTGATERLKQLNPSRFNFIADADTTVDGFLAHEVADVVPEAISGTKDAMRDEEYEVTPAVTDEEGNVTTKAVMGEREVPDYQGIDQSKLVPLLVATIQELEARITQLENN